MPAATRAQLDRFRSEIRGLAAPVDASAERDPLTFARALGLELDLWQARIIAEAQPRTILNCSRQAGKSTAAAVLALHEAIFKPNSLTLLVSPSLRQSSELFRTITGLRQRLPWLPALSEDNRLSLTIRGGGRIVSLPSSESTVRGFSSVTLLVEDESARVDDSLHLAVLPMLAVTRGRLLLMSSPWAKRGHFHDIWTNGQGWHRERVTVHDVPRIAPEWIDEQRRSMPDMWFRSEYLCEFVDAEDGVFLPEHIDEALSSDVAPLFGGDHE